MDIQDWAPVVMKSSVKKAAAHGSGPKIVERDGAARSASAHATKLDTSDIPSKPKTLSLEMRQELTNARVALKKSQVQLNQACAFPANCIREMEAGRLTPNGQQLNKLNSVLKISLHLS